MTRRDAITQDELRAAYKRAAYLKRLGWSFERAVASPLMLLALQGQAIAARHRAENMKGSLI